MVKKGQDVDHKVPLSKGGAETALSNLRALPPGKNRSFKRKSDGSVK
jgi:5-methylcytosine-specific restriction endonuclease McrA